MPSHYALPTRKKQVTNAPRVARLPIDAPLTRARQRKPTGPRLPLDQSFAQSPGLPPIADRLVAEGQAFAQNQSPSGIPTFNQTPRGQGLGGNPDLTDLIDNARTAFVQDQMAPTPVSLPSVSDAVTGDALAAPEYFRGIAQGNQDVEQGLALGLPGKVDPVNQRGMLDLIRGQAGRQASLEGLRSQVGRQVTLPDGKTYSATGDSPPLYGASEASGGNVRVGPRVGTEGLPPYVTESEILERDHAKRRAEAEIANAALADFKEKRGALPPMSEADRTRHKDAADAAYQRSKASRRGKHDAGRAANYGRRHGLPPAIAKAGIQGMDKLDKDPNAQLTDAQKTGIGQPTDQEMKMQRMIAMASISQALAGREMPLDPATQEMLDKFRGEFDGKQNQPGLPPADGGYNQEEIDMVGAGDVAGADESMARRATWDNARTQVSPEYLAAYDEAVAANDEAAVQNFLLQSGVPTDEVYRIMNEGLGIGRYGPGNPSGSLWQTPGAKETSQMYTFGPR